MVVYNYAVCIFVESILFSYLFAKYFIYCIILIYLLFVNA